MDQRDVPHDADKFQWDKFVVFAEENGISLEYKVDWFVCWRCWKEGYIAGFAEVCP